MSKNLEKYYELIDKKLIPVSNENATLKIISDRNQIEDWIIKGAAAEEIQIGVLFQDRYITLIRDLVEFPDGRIGGYNRIISTATLFNGASGSVILPVIEKKIILLKTFRHPIRAWSYEFPRGFGEPKYSPEENARKELSEEIGGEIETIFSLGLHHSNSGLEGNAANLFIAFVSKMGNLEKAEGIEDYLLVSCNEMEEMIRNGDVTDGFTIDCYMRAKLKGYLNNC